MAHRAALRVGKAVTNPAQDVSSADVIGDTVGERHTQADTHNVVNYENTVKLELPLQLQGSEKAALGTRRHQLDDVEGKVGKAS